MVFGGVTAFEYGDAPDGSPYPGPIYIPRNHMLQDAIDTAERDGDFGAYLALLAAVTDPYNPDAGEEWMAQPEKPGPFRTFCGT